jgi:hypothetical protein
MVSKTTNSSGKATIYVDVDDEITNIIEKVKTSNDKIIALVLPKRAAVMQSVVNMKLLKRAATVSKKHVVLITSEAGLMPLAGAAGLHVAKSPQSKPAIPPPPQQLGDETENLEDKDLTPSIDKTATIGALAAASAADDETETIELDNIDSTLPGAGGLSALKQKKLKHLKVPNFEKFRLVFFLAGLGLVLLIVGWYFAAVVLPKAKVTIMTDTTSVVSSFDFTASTSVTELDLEAKKIPATAKEVKKTDSEKTPATGQRDDGTKASGEVSLSAPCTSSAITVPAGTALSTGGLNFLTQEAVKIDNLSGGGPGNWICTDKVDVTAAQNGDGYNIGNGKSFTVSGYSTVSGTNTNGFGGGTSKLVKVVSQKDIDDATAKMKSRQDEAATQELQTALETENKYALVATLKAGEPKVTATPKLNEEATEVTITSETTYNMLGIERDHLSQIIKNDVSDKIDTEKQAITNDGIDSAILRINNQPTPLEASISFRTSAVAGPEIKPDEIKEAIRGKKRGEAQAYISNLPGVREVEVNYSPFWVYSTPKAAKKITITVEKTDDEQQPESSNE